jgi:isocitrate dehydrogenase
MSTSQQSTIIYTLTDEAPLLATSCVPAHHPARLQPRRAFKIDTADISVAARVLAQFPELLREDQRVPDTLGELGKLTLSVRTPTSSSCPTSAPPSRS